ncbi:MAG: hypothetical protein ACKPKK_03315, partial [Dolichospermum sp.]
QKIYKVKGEMKLRKTIEVILRLRDGRQIHLKGSREIWTKKGQLKNWLSKNTKISLKRKKK